MGAPVLQHRLAKSRTALAIAERVDFEVYLEAQFAPQLVHHDHQLGVGRRVGAAEDLDAELRELAKAALLRTLAPEHRPDIIEALLGIAAIHPGFDVRAHHARRTFWPERERGFRLVAIE